MSATLRNKKTGGRSADLGARLIKHEKNPARQLQSQRRAGREGAETSRVQAICGSGSLWST